MWSRLDLKKVAGECKILLEGAIDRLNDLALDRYDDLLLEEEDPVHVNPTVVKEFIDEHH